MSVTQMPTTCQSQSLPILCTCTRDCQTVAMKQSCFQQCLHHNWETTCVSTPFTGQSCMWGAEQDEPSPMSAILLTSIFSIWPFQWINTCFRSTSSTAEIHTPVLLDSAWKHRCFRSCGSNFDPLKISHLKIEEVRIAGTEPARLGKSVTQFKPFSREQNGKQNILEVHFA